MFDFQICSYKIIKDSNVVQGKNIVLALPKHLKYNGCFPLPLTIILHMSHVKECQAFLKHCRKSLRL